MKVCLTYGPFGGLICFANGWIIYISANTFGDEKGVHNVKGKFHFVQLVNTGVVVAVGALGMKVDGLKRHHGACSRGKAFSYFPEINLITFYNQKPDNY